MAQIIAAILAALSPYIKEWLKKWLHDRMHAVAPRVNTGNEEESGNVSRDLLEEVRDSLWVWQVRKKAFLDAALEVVPAAVSTGMPIPADRVNKVAMAAKAAG